MRIRSNETQPYERQVLPSEEIPIVKSLSEERSRDIPQVPANPIWGALEKSSDIVYAVANNMMEVENIEIHNAAQIEMSKRLTQSRLDIINDPKYLQSTAGELTGEWRKRSDAVRENIVDPIKNKKIRADLSKNWQVNDNDNMVFFTAHGWQNTIARSKNQRDEFSIEQTMSYVNNGDPKSTLQLTNMVGMLNKQVAARLMTKEDADHELQLWQNNTSREFFQRQFITQIQNDLKNYKSNSVSLGKQIDDNQVLNANDKTVLMHQLDQFTHEAERRAKQDAEVGQEKVVYADVFSKFTTYDAKNNPVTDNDAAAKWIRDPRHYADLKISSRNTLAAIFEHMHAVKERDLGEARDKIMSDFLPRIYDAGSPNVKPLTRENIYNAELKPEQQEHFIKLLAMPVNKKDFTADWNKYNTRLAEAYRGEIKNTDDIFSAGEDYTDIGIKEREHIFNVAKTYEKNETKAIKTIVDYGNKVIKETTLVPALDDPEKSIAKRTAEFEKNLNKAIAKGQAEGKELKNMLDPNNKSDYIVDEVLSKSILSREDQFKGIGKKTEQLKGDAQKKDGVVIKEVPKPMVAESPERVQARKELRKHGKIDSEANIQWYLNVTKKEAK